MDSNRLIKIFKEYNLEVLNQYAGIISSKASDGRIFPPYVPLIGSEYDKYKILIYATAQSIPINSPVALQYEKHYDKLIERLYYSWKFDRKYPDIKFEEVLIAPYQEGILPALAGLLLFIQCGERVSDFNSIQDKMAVTNYYKFSLYDKTDINPNGELQSPEDYWRLNDELAKRELETLQPQIILSFNGRHVNRLRMSGYRVITINDPSWILQGGGGCLKTEGSWGKKIKKLEGQPINSLVDQYVENLRDRYKGKKESVKIYLLNYYLEMMDLPLARQ